MFHVNSKILEFRGYMCIMYNIFVKHCIVLHYIINQALST